MATPAEIAAAKAQAAALAAGLDAGIVGTGNYGFGNIPGVQTDLSGTSIDEIIGKLIRSGQANQNAVWAYLGGSGTVDPQTLSETIKKSYALAGNPQAKLNQIYPQAGLALATINNSNSAAAAADAARAAAAQARADRIASLQDNSYATLQNTLENWGLQSLTPMVHDMVFSSDQNISPQVIDAIRNSDAYQQRFPGLAKLKAVQGGATESTYMNLEDSITQNLTGYSMDPNFLNRAELGTLIGNGMYGKNLSDRLSKGMDVLNSASPAVLKSLRDYYGVDTGNLLGYVLDPNKSMNGAGNTGIANQIQAAQAGGSAINAGFTGETKAMSELLASTLPASSTSPATFDQGFAKAAALQPLEQAQIGQRGQAVASSNTLAVGSFNQLGSMFNTTQDQAEAQITLSEEARKAGLSGGGGFAQTARGGVGVGQTSTEGTGK